MAINRFTKQPFGGYSGTFACNMCGHMTRDTGENAGCGLCPLCYEDCQLENQLQDGYITEEEHAAAIAKLEKRYIKRDGKSPYVSKGV